MSAAGIGVIQASAWYPPYDLGGTEVYLEGLVGGLRSLGIDSSVVVPRPAAAPERYAHDGAIVETYEVNSVPEPGEMQAGRAHSGFEAFRTRLAAQQCGIYHQHSWTRGCGPHHLRAAREMGFKTVLTVHVPGNVCLRGTMLRFGQEPCDGRVEQQRCGACWAHGRGLAKPLAEGIARLPAALAKRARSGATRLSTALSARALAAERVESLLAMAANADRVVAVCEWLFQTLALNGVPPEKLVLNRQGISEAFSQKATAIQREPSRQCSLRLLYIGRWDEVKGIDIAVRAVRALPATVDVVLAICAIPKSPGERTYETMVRELAAGERRVVILPPVPRAELIPLLEKHDVLIVPSIGLETGPLVVLEAQAAGMFVLGSRLGGIAELVDERDAGALVEAGDVAAWSSAIERLWRRHRAGGLPRPKRSVRTMDAVAADMAEVYRSL